MKIWKSREEEALAKGLLTSQIPLPEIVLRFLRARGLTEEGEIVSFLNPRLADLADPFKMKGMREAVDRLVKAYRDQERVCVYADFDLDGTSGLALLWQSLEDFGYKNLVGYQPLRLSEGYGLHVHAIEELAAQGVKVLVTVDVGITAVAAVQRAQDLGLDVILTDHHLPGAELPPALAIVNPNQGDCPSELGFLCGAGVAFYLVRALKRGLVDQKLISEKALPLRGLLDFVTIATLTDMVPIVKDNRAMVRAGLEELSQTVRPGLKALLEKLSLFGKTLSSQDVAIKFAPKLNALSRMETGLRPIDLFRARALSDADVMVDDVLENNSARVELQSRGESCALAMLQEWPHERFIFLVSSEFHRGVVGLIATKISQLKNCPTFIGALSDEGVIVGSARAPQGYALSLVDALGEASGSLNRFGGHFGAAGFELHENVQGKVLDSLVSFFSDDSRRAQKVVMNYDLALSLDEINEALVRHLDGLGPYGQSFPQPLFCFHEAELLDKKVLKGGHIKVWFRSEHYRRGVEALYFSPPPEIERFLTLGARVDLLGELQWNDFSGSRTVQILIRDLQPSGKHSIEQGVVI